MVYQITDFALYYILHIIYLFESKQISWFDSALEWYSNQLFYQLFHKRCLWIKFYFWHTIIRSRRCRCVMVIKSF